VALGPGEKPLDFGGYVRTLGIYVLAGVCLAVTIYCGSVTLAEAHALY